MISYHVQDTTEIPKESVFCSKRDNYNVLAPNSDFFSRNFQKVDFSHNYNKFSDIKLKVAYTMLFMV